MVFKFPEDFFDLSRGNPVVAEKGCHRMTSLVPRAGALTI